MNIRKYQEPDHRDIADLFYSAVHSISTSVYSKEAQEAWAPSAIDYEKWQVRLARTQPFVAVDNGIVMGFLELESDGYIDCLYVHADHQRKGVASQLLQDVFHVSKVKSIKGLYVKASEIAKPFFLKHGFILQSTHKVELNGQRLTNYLMTISLDGTAPIKKTH